MKACEVRGAVWHGRRGVCASKVAWVLVAGVQVHDGLLKNIKRRMTPQPVKIRADVELTCFQYDGIEHIKAAMKAAEAQGTEVSTKQSVRWGHMHCHILRHPVNAAGTVSA